ncbi:MAG: D-alanyl-D-alanine carboxypeptidase [Lachnospiraceae bacterium]|nr:D-alanyl-D-alanine carboxypeptidase [Lachnospiraceae bacterium]
MKIFQYCVFRFQDTMKKRRKRIISFILALFILSIFFDKSGLAVNAQEIYETEQPQLQLYAMSAVLIDATNDRILYQKDAFKVMPMASTTKIMTAILALENGNPDDVVTVSKRAASMPKVHLGMREGEQFYLKDLLKSLMLESHNDSAVAIAEHIGGSMEGFADMMNAKAKELNCENTYFITPNGLDAEKDGNIHSTTAYDLAKIAAYAIQNQDFLNLVATRNAQFSELGSGRAFSVYNRDRFLDMMDGALGVKTGFTNKAGYCFVGAVDRDGKKLVSVVLACGWPPHKNYKWADTAALMNYGLDNYEYREIAWKEIPVSIPVTGGVEVKTPLYMEDETPQTCLLSAWDKVEVTCEIKDGLSAPVDVDEIVGYEKIYINGEEYKSCPIRTKNAVLPYTFIHCIKEVLRCFFIQEFC